MRIRKAVAVSIIVMLATAAACGSDGLYPTDGGGNGGGNGGGGGGGGGGGSAGAVTIGSGIQFVSDHNGTMNPAVDTITAGSTFTWSWTGTLPHSVQSVGTPSFTSSDTRTGSGSYVVTFPTPGRYQYQCSVHGAAMTGTIVVLPATTPTASYDATATVADPANDTFGTGGTRWDLTALTVQSDLSSVTAMLDFSRDVVSPATGAPDAVIGFLDLDLDQSSSTGVSAMADEFRQDGGSTGLGVDRSVNLGELDAEGSASVTDGLGQQTGRVTPTYAGKRITVRIPKGMLGDDDGLVNAAAIAGVSGSGASDFIPDSGNLALTAPSLSLASITASPNDPRSRHSQFLVSEIDR